VTPADLTEYLGPRRFREEVLDEADEVGVATGLSVTPAAPDQADNRGSAGNGDAGAARGLSGLTAALIWTPRRSRVACAAPARSGAVSWTRGEASA
jgi:hypothetical protein